MKVAICNYCNYIHFSVKKTKYGYQLTCLQCGEVDNYYTKRRIEKLDNIIRNGGIL